MSATVLLIDAGNTSIKWRLLNAQSKAVVCGGVTDKPSSDEAFAAVFDASLSKVLLAEVGAWALYAAIHELRERKALSFIVEEIHSKAELLGVKNSYAEPARLGVDRFLSSVEAFLQAQCAVCVIDLGTAAKADVVDGNGVHQGGYIVPGFGLLRSSLLGGTQKVRYQSDELEPVQGFGKSTAAAVESGCDLMLKSWLCAVKVEFFNAYPSGKLFVCGGDSSFTDILGEYRCNENLILAALSRLV